MHEKWLRFTAAGENVRPVDYGNKYELLLCAQSSLCVATKSNPQSD